MTISFFHRGELLAALGCGVAQEPVGPHRRQTQAEIGTTIRQHQDDISLLPHHTPHLPLAPIFHYHNPAVPLLQTDLDLLPLNHTLLSPQRQ